MDTIDSGDENNYLDATDVQERASKFCVGNCTVPDNNGKMIACDNTDCLTEWFHVQCMGFTDENCPGQSDDWLCPTCKELDRVLEEEQVLANEKLGEIVKPKIKVKSDEIQAEPTEEKISQAVGGPSNVLKKMGRGRPRKEVSSGTPSGAASAFFELPKGQKKNNELSALQKEQEALDIEIARMKVEKSRAQLAKLKIDEVVESTSKKPEAAAAPASVRDLLQKLIEEDEEEYDGKKKKNKSGLYKKSSEETPFPQKWPHLHLGMEYTGKTFGIYDLKVEQFVAGETEIIQGCQGVERDSRLHFLKVLMYEATSYKFDSVLRYYAAWVREIEMGKKKWGDDFTQVRDILKRAGSGPGSVPGSDESKKKSKAVPNKSSKVWYCTAFNRGKCPKESPHNQLIQGKWKEVNHICSACYFDSKTEATHPSTSSECPLYEEQ